MFSVEKMYPITCVDTFYDGKGTFLMVFGDELGYVRI